MLPEIALIVAVVYAVYQIRKFYHSTSKFPWIYLFYYLILYANTTYSANSSFEPAGFPIRVANGEMEYVTNKRFTDGNTNLVIQSSLTDTTPILGRTTITPSTAPSVPSAPSDPVALLALSG